MSYGHFVVVSSPSTLKSGGISASPRTISIGEYVQYVCVVITYNNKNMDQPGKVANPARGQLNRENEYFPVRVARA